MAAADESTDSWPVRIKALAGTLRELIFTGAILLCLVRPTTVPQWLCSAGFKRSHRLRHLGGAEGVHRAKQQASAELSQVNSQLAGTPVEQQVSQPVSGAVLAAVSLAQLLAPGAVPTSGWFFLGKASADQTQWRAGDSRRLIEPTPLPIKTGIVVTAKEDVYLRADVPSTSMKSTGSIVSVEREGQAMVVEKTDSTSAKEGGSFVWARYVHEAPH